LSVDVTLCGLDLPNTREGHVLTEVLFVTEGGVSADCYRRRCVCGLFVAEGGVSADCLLQIIFESADSNICSALLQK